MDTYDWGFWCVLVMGGWKEGRKGDWIDGKKDRKKAGVG